MKTVGILGGLGPETTANFYLYIIAECQRMGGLHRPNMLMHNLPIPYPLEEALLLFGQDAEHYLPHLIEHAKLLERSGADFVVMPCNTLHRFEDEIRNAISIPFISIIDVVEKFVCSAQQSRIGLIATGVTLSSEFYQNRFDKIGLKYITPNDFQQVKIAKMIHGLVTGKYANNQRQVLIDIVNEFAEQDVEQTLLACTDLQSLIPQHPTMKIIDTMQLLANEVVKEIHR